MRVQQPKLPLAYFQPLLTGIWLNPTHAHNEHSHTSLYINRRNDISSLKNHLSQWTILGFVNRSPHDQNHINALKERKKNETSKLLLQSPRALKCCFHPILTKINVYFYYSVCREVANGFGIKDNILIQPGAGGTETLFTSAHFKPRALLLPYHWLIKSKMTTHSVLMLVCSQK